MLKATYEKQKLEVVDVVICQKEDLEVHIFINRLPQNYPFPELGNLYVEIDEIAVVKNRLYLCGVFIQTKNQKLEKIELVFTDIKE